MLEQVPGRTCGPVERRAHAGAGLLAGLVTLWGTHAGAVSEELQPVGRTHIREVHGLCCQRDPTAEQGQGEDSIAVLNPITWPKGARGGDCNGNTFKLL